MVNDLVQNYRDQLAKSSASSLESALGYYILEDLFEEDILGFATYEQFKDYADDISYWDFQDNDPTEEELMAWEAYLPAIYNKVRSLVLEKA